MILNSFCTRPTSTVLDPLNYTPFAECLGSAFQLTYGEAATLSLELQEAQPLRLPEHQPQAREPFSLIFRGPLDPQLPQAIYPLEHGQLGELEIFLVPIKRDAQGMYYEAIFN
jgi:hypothetical protein